MREPGQPAVFLDRDGTINREVDYLADPDRLELLPGAADALNRLRAAGFLNVVVTNQSGIARGLFDEEQLERIHERLALVLAREDARLDGIYYCPHHPQAVVQRYRMDCECRKPRPGLLMRAIHDLRIDPTRSFVVGDSARDLEAGAGLGIPGILVATGKGELEHARLVRENENEGTVRNMAFVRNLAAAANYILTH